MSALPPAPRASLAPKGSQLAAVLAVFAAGGAVGCSTGDGEASLTPIPTTISVDPIAFLGDEVCAQTPGAMRSYVATVTDQTEGFVLASSGPVPCTSPVGFRFVLVGHEYTAEVDAYELSASELTPVGGENSGNRAMVLVDGGEPAVPRWGTLCGEGASVTAEQNADIVVAPCEPLSDSGSSTTTSIVVDPTVTAGALGCAVEATEEDPAVAGIESFEIIPDAAELGVGVTDCGGTPVTYDAGLEIGTTYRFTVLGTYSGETEPGYAARCKAQAKDGVQVVATCDPLTDAGSLEADVAAVLEQTAFTCSSVASVALSASLDESDPPQTFATGSLPCQPEIVLGPLPAGDYTAELVVVGVDGTLLTSACTGTTTPGTASPLTCDPPQATDGE